MLCQFYSGTVFLLLFLWTKTIMTKNGWKTDNNKETEVRTRYKKWTKIETIGRGTQKHTNKNKIKQRSILWKEDRRELFILCVFRDFCYSCLWVGLCFVAWWFLCLMTFKCSPTRRPEPQQELHWAHCNWPIFNSGAPEAEHTGSNKGKGQAAMQPSHCLGVSQVSLHADEGGQPFQKNVGRFPRCSCASED